MAVTTAPGSATAPNPTAIVKYNPTSWARQVLTDDGKPVTPDNVEAVRDWEDEEGGEWVNTARFNPLDTTQQEPGSVPYEAGKSVQAYPDWGSGLAATVTTLNYSDYTGIQSALAAGDNAQAVEDAITSSKWGTKSLTLGQGDHYNPSSKGPAGSFSSPGTNTQPGANGSSSTASSPGGSSWIQSLDSALNPTTGGITHLGGDLQMVAVRGALALAGVIIIGMGLLLAFGHDIFGGVLSHLPIPVPA